MTSRSRRDDVDQLRINYCNKIPAPNAIPLDWSSTFLYWHAGISGRLFENLVLIPNYLVTAAKMPADIRSFFGGGPKATPGSQPSQSKENVR